MQANAQPPASGISSKLIMPFVNSTMQVFTTMVNVRPQISEPSIAGRLSMNRMAIHGGFQITDLMEQAPDARVANRFPRAEKYIDWPMLIVLSPAAASE